MLKLLFALGIFGLALWPRTVGLATFVTTDELFWVGRSGNFGQALAAGRPAGTFQSGHPGVTTMWVGLLGLGTERAIGLASEQRTGEVSRSEVARNPAFLSGLADARRAVALTSAAAIAVITILAWRLLGPGPAVFGGALLALDPFFLAHSQLLHIDALLSSFMTIAVLAGLVRWLAGGGRGYLALSALSSGLALLSKSPALFLAGFLPLVALLAAWRAGRLASHRTWLDLGAWLGLTALTYLLAWPAVWAAPAETLRGVLGFIAGNTNPDHAAIGEEGSGALFYVAAFLLRTTPLTLVGLGLLVVETVAALARGRRAGSDSDLSNDGGENGKPSVWSVGARPTVVGALLAYALLFGMAMTVAAKSFDRYLLPAFPAVDLLAGLGLALSARRLQWVGGAGWLLATGALLPVLVFPVGSTLPYALTWYNPLAGGGPAAARVLAVGWGEGLDQVARHLNLKPDAERLKVAMPGEIYTTVLDAQFVGSVLPFEGGDPIDGGADYFVTYLRARQDGLPLYDPRFQEWPPELVLRLGGVEYARVYPVGSGIPVGARFGDLATLEAYGFGALTTRPGRSASVRLVWRSETALPSDASVILTLTDLTGREVGRTEAPLGRLPAGELHSRTYRLEVPAGLPAGEYLVWAGLETAGQAVGLADRPDALADRAPEAPERVVLRSIRVR